MSGVLEAASSVASALPWLGSNLRPAALRGIPFYVTSAEDEPARRWVTHEFPGRDEPWHEDLGAKARSFALDGLLVGSDVVLQARAFAAAANAPEPATLLHPWLGAIEVVVLDCRIRFDVNEGRVARIQLRLERAGRRPAPVLSADGLGRVVAEADRLLTAAHAAYTRVRAMVGAVDFVVATVRGTVTGFAAAIQGAIGGAGLLGALAGPLGLSLGALGAASDGDVASDAALPAIVTAPLRDISAAAGGRAAIPTREDDAAPAPKAAFDALLALAAVPIVAPTEAATPARRQIGTATEALGTLAQAAVAGELARAAMAVAWPSRDEAMAARDQVVDALSLAAERAAAAGWDDVWRTLTALRAASAADLAARAAPLPRIRLVELPAVLPATLIAYRLDGDSLGDVFGRGADIALRNRIRHPGFVPAARPIEVLA